MSEFAREECCSCGVVFGMTMALYRARRSDRATFYCPNGHAQSYTESAESRMRRERDRALQDQARLQDELSSAQRRLADAEAKAGKAQRALKRAGDRIHRGICPHCNRTFVQLARHMATKHPGSALVAEVA